MCVPSVPPVPYMAFQRASGCKKPEQVETRKPFHPFQHGGNCRGDGLALVFLVGGADPRIHLLRNR